MHVTVAKLVLSSMDTQNIVIIFLFFKLLECNLEHYMKTHKQFSSADQIEICFPNEVRACKFI